MSAAFRAGSAVAIGPRMGMGYICHRSHLAFISLQLAYNSKIDQLFS